ncbi:hypothetical protein HANVADRAFT_51410 [Hanseniaspora valbyensis NRRL Y-1626]|uniref:Succinate dehydrogenase [ubiquinone] cytochrome b small subunit n=1 Tax=Hanseniaspora valbyensis NRRL Y-1626 TaxID=766949 RepID=A0A1B7TID0_9ASCO|nr:hypothetical protein HANVADRAFT_51410 [Hanseniaspora valbyensis NRRL Y-1626]
MFGFKSAANRSSLLLKNNSTKKLLINSNKNSLRHFTIPFLPTLPQNPGGVKGSINDNLSPPHVDKMHASYHWDFEKVVSVGLIPLVSMALINNGSISTLVDISLCYTLLMHCYVGFQSCIIDYIPKRVYGVWHNRAMYMLTLGTFLSVIGIYDMNTNEKNSGSAGLVSKLWAAKSEKVEEEKK